MRLRLTLLVFLTLVSPVLAQTPTATLVGDVKDSSGGLVPGATITVRNTATNVGRTTQTDGSGAYTMVSLAPGLYEVTAGISGFKEARTVVRLSVGEARRVDF
ncbi:MAG TPA: carboxypeptidase-like regulatory domain-containing protein, partial [Vicinamibacteria bacterium]